MSTYLLVPIVYIHIYKYNCRGIFDSIKDNDPSFNLPTTHSHACVCSEKVYFFFYLILFLYHLFKINRNTSDDGR